MLYEVITILFGNLLALKQTNIKRLLGYLGGQSANTDDWRNNFV